MEFLITNGADGLVLWPAGTKLVLDRDGSYFDEDCKARGDCCGYDMYEILVGIVPQDHGYAVPRLPYGIYKIETKHLEHTPMPKENWPK